jgi:hypothetical protein
MAQSGSVSEPQALDAIDALDEAGIDPIVLLLAAALSARTPLRAESVDDRRALGARASASASAGPASRSPIGRAPRPTRKG